MEDNAFTEYKQFYSDYFSTERRHVDNLFYTIEFEYAKSIYRTLNNTVFWRSKILHYRLNFEVMINSFSRDKENECRRSIFISLDG